MHLKHMLPYQLPRAAAANLAALVPAGSVETHGPHMAVGDAWVKMLRGGK